MAAAMPAEVEGEPAGERAHDPDFFHGVLDPGIQRMPEAREGHGGACARKGGKGPIRCPPR